MESAQAATLTVNNLNDSGVGSLRDTINIASNNDVLEFLLGSHPSTITLTSGVLAIAKNLTINGPGANLLTISSNNHLPVLDINAANVTFSGLAIAGNINAYNSSNLTFTNSTISGDNLNIDSNLTLINSTINSKRLVINGGLTGIDDSNVTALDSITIGGNLTSSSGNLTISTGSLRINASSNNSEAGSLTVTADDSVVVTGSQVTIPISTSGNSGQINGDSHNSGAGGTLSITMPNLILRRVPKPSAIAAGNINSGAAGNITINSGTLILNPGAIISKPVPEPSAIAGTILAGSLAWLVKRKQVVFRKAKV
ncbi:PEP-CTERM sorting domain-containing protein [Nostoc sp. 'Peltigera malacea cyanobiont' DB3992]|uniref:PEP-CTERM sorting domain-containing protein n=1 Tax=Nostoc sp. 'Peltigera malacea cyanobiont' DB3992 TaxID=1206980 RepID=UPI0015D4CCCF|nr:PEP-CTERM sorting domain-containing protein [Nostoc sp. 'Peltigera malacea cyanobiont' DB3992]